MDKAIIIDKAEGTQQELDADNFAVLLREYPDLKSSVLLRDNETANPVVFRPTSYRDGNEVRVRAHFAFASGYAPHEEHVFNNPKGYSTITEAVEADAKIVLSHNAGLSYRKLDFRQMMFPGALPVEEWKGANQGNYISVSVKTAGEAVRKIQTVGAVNEDVRLNDTIFALYRGSVIPYREYFLGQRTQDMTQLYHNLTNEVSGLALGNSRVVGFPRLFQFVATQRTIERKCANGVQGHIAYADGRVHFNQLVFSQQPQKAGAEKTEFLSRVWEKLVAGNGELYVMASPSVTIGKEPDKWAQTRWIVTDVDSQLMPIKNNPQPRYDSSLFRPQELIAA